MQFVPNVSLLWFRKIVFSKAVLDNTKKNEDNTQQGMHEENGYGASDNTE